MKNIEIPVLAIGLALVLAGCSNSERPQYSPDGRSLAYVKKGHLMLRKDGREQALSKEPPSALTWSPDGAFLAWTTGREEQSGPRGGPLTRRHETTHIFAPATRAVALSADVGSPLAWLNGDLLVTDKRKPAKPRLAMLDAGSGQIRTEVDMPETPIELAEGTARREVYVQFHGDSPWEAFDGLNLRPMPGTARYEIFPLANGESLFCKDLVKQYQHDYVLYRWEGDKLRNALTVKLPPKVSGREGLIFWSLLEGVTSDLQHAVVSASLIVGSPVALNDLKSTMKRYPTMMSGGKVPKSVERRLNREFKHAKPEDFVYVWSASTGGRVEDVPSKKHTGAVRMAIDPSGKHLAIVDDDGLNVVDLP